MAKTIVVKPLGLVLRKAGLVSSEQVEKALAESLTLPQCRVGEILSIRGFIKPETADFFADVWPKIILQTGKQNANKKLQHLGQYLKAANLISQQQINRIITIQKTNSIKFGKLAVENNIISQDTFNFFIEHLDLIETESEINVYPEDVALELDKIENYLLNNQKCEPIELLKRYQIINSKGKIIANEDIVEKELLASGIIIRKNSLIRIAKPIYENKFDDDWLEKELAHLQPYNQIRLKMFDINKKAVIPYKIINAVNYWTDREPFLTQKVYQLVQEKLFYIPIGTEATMVEKLVYQYIIDDWQKGVAAKHLKRISDRIMHYQSDRAKILLKTYKKIYQLKKIDADDSWDQTELLRIGLIKLDDKAVEVSNPIYQAVFDLQWVNDILSKKLSISTSQKSIPQTKKAALFPQKVFFKPKNLFSVSVIVLLFINTYLVVKMIDSLLEEEQPVEQNIIW